MAGELSCPSCGAAVPVRSAALPYVTCPYCRSLIRRGQQGAQAIGQVAELPFDVSPIQIGTGGRIGGFAYNVVGRVRWGWSDGSWNEWLLECSDGKLRWLAEAMGSFMLTEERPELLRDEVLAAFAQGRELARGVHVAADGIDFIASDIKQAECLGSEGALPMPTAIGTRMTSVDFRSDSAAVLSVQRDSAGAQAWLGNAYDLAGLNAGNLRRIEGWALPKGLK